MESLKFFRKMADEIEAVAQEKEQLRLVMMEIAKKLNCYPAVPSKYAKASEGGLGAVILAVLADAPSIDAHALSGATEPKT